MPMELLIVFILPLIIGAFFGWLIPRVVIQIVWIKNFHPIGKIFRRGKGVPEKEILKRGCLRKSSKLVFIKDLFFDPRLNNLQREQILSDVFSNIARCPFGEQTLHDPKIVLTADYSYAANQLLKGRFRKLNPSTIETMMYGLAPYKSNMLNSSTITENEYSKDSQELKLFKRVFSDKGIRQEFFKKTFEQLIIEIDNSLKSNYFDHEISDAFRDLIQSCLSNPKFTNEDILSFCYSDKKFLRKALLNNPRCPEEGKVIISLMNGSQVAR